MLSRLSSPHRATVDLDVVDRLLGGGPHLEVLRSAEGARAVEPAGVLLPTPYGEVKVDVLAARQIEIDSPSDDPGDRLHATAHAWAHDTAADMLIEVSMRDGSRLSVTTPVAQAGTLIAMKLQAMMNRSTSRQATGLRDIVRITLDDATRRPALDQLASVDPLVAADIALHVELWFRRKRLQTSRLVRGVGDELTVDDVDLVGELLWESTRRPTVSGGF